MKYSPEISMIKMLTDVTSGRVSVAKFCSDFELVYNDDLEKSSVPKKILALYRGVFDIVVWHSQFPDEREDIHNYKNDDDVLFVAKAALVELERNNRMEILDEK